MTASGGKIVEKLIRPVLFGPLGAITTGPKARTPWAGLTTLPSGSSAVTVSTTLVTSGCMFLLGSQISSAGVAANSGGGIAVNSIVNGVSFALARPTGVAVPWSEHVSWMLVLRDPF